MDRKQLYLAVLMVLVVSAVVVANDGYPDPEELEAKFPWLPILYSVVCLAGILVVGFKNCKRTHLD